MQALRPRKVPRKIAYRKSYLKNSHLAKRFWKISNVTMTHGRFCFQWTRSSFPRTRRSSKLQWICRRLRRNCTTLVTSPKTSSVWTWGKSSTTVKCLTRTIVLSEKRVIVCASFSKPGGTSSVFLTVEDYFILKDLTIEEWGPRKTVFKLQRGVIDKNWLFIFL
jgi:hypothetical protein